MLAHPLIGSGVPARRRAGILAVASLTVTIAAGCAAPGPEPEVLTQTDPAGDPIVVFATTKCEVGNADGQRCDKKTCKTDDKSNCEYFASRCLATGHHYSGTKDEGTCTRAHDNDRPS